MNQLKTTPENNEFSGVFFLFVGLSVTKDRQRQVSMNGMASMDEELGRPPSLVEGFDSVWLLDANLTAEHWKYLWQRFGVRELIDIGRRSGWLNTGNNRDAVLMLLGRSREAGYDPLEDGVSAEEPVKVV